MSYTVTLLADNFVDGANYENGYSCHREYLIKGGVPDSTVLPEIGKPYADADWPVSVAGATYKVSDYRLTALVKGAAYVLSIDGATRLRGEVGSDRFAISLSRRVSQEYEPGSMRITLDMVGCRKATETDAGHQTQGDPNTTKALLDPEGNACKAGRIIYMDATTASAGAPEDDKNRLSWVSGASTATNPLTYKDVDRDVDLTTYRLTFWLRDTAANRPSLNFVGVANPSTWATKYQPDYFSGAGYVGSQGGKWLCHRQNISPELDDRGNEYMRITRTFLCAPAGWYWSLSHYGTWTWNP